MASYCRVSQWEYVCSCMCNLVLSDWLCSYIMAAQMALKIFKIAAYFSDRCILDSNEAKTKKNNLM